MDFRGVVVEESLADKGILKELFLLDIINEVVGERHCTPWLFRWTKYFLEVPERRMEDVARRISGSIDPAHGNSWYADFRNDKFHYVIFHNRVFRVDRSRPEEYREAVDYGLSLGIPPHRLGFPPGANGK